MREIVRILFLWLLVIGADVAYGNQPINSIIAIVNEDTITRLEIEREIELLQENNSQLNLEESKKEALDNLIDRHLQLQLTDRLQIKIPDDALENRLSQLQAQFNLNTTSDLEKFAQNQFGLSYAQFRKRVREDMRIQSLFYRMVYSKVRVYQDEIDQFLKQETKLGVRQQYHLAHILIAANDENRQQQKTLAMTLRQNIKQGADFATVAKTYSSGKRAGRGGDLGYRAESELPALFVGEAQQLTVGGMSEVIESRRGFHILKLLDVRGERFREEIRQVRLRHIFLPIEDDDLPFKVYQQIQQEMSFERAVKEYSVDSKSVDQEGDLGWFRLDEVPPYFSEVVQSLSLGDVSNPVKSPFGWHILKIADQKVNKLDIKTIRQQAEQIIRERRALSQRQVWLGRLRGSAYINILSVDYR